MSAYYNEFDPKAAAWLRELIRAGHIAAGDVDERSIKDVQPNDVKGYTQVHLFAGIGGWPYALRLAGWADDVAVWTGSCPCPPFSAAGKKKRCPACDGRVIPCPRRTGFFICIECEHAWHADERHLWPEMWRLIRDCRPAFCFGEQVASADGRIWLAGVRGSLEILGYAARAADLCSASVGATDWRQRLWWMANTNRQRFSGRTKPNRHSKQRAKQASRRPDVVRCGDPDVGDAKAAGLQGEWSEYRPSGEGCSGLTGLAMQVGVPQWNGPTIAIRCTDGARRASAEPGSFPLAHGVPARVVRLRGYGNAINPYVAKKFIQASIETREVVA